jgi:tetratricopeptide (TPR) repeat protein
MEKIFWLRCIFFIVMISGLAWAQDAAQYLTAANQLYGAKDYAKAVQYYQATTQINPNSVEAYQGLGNSYYAQGNNAEALKAYEKALQLNPGNTQLSSFVNTLRVQTRAGSSAFSYGTNPYTPASHGVAKTIELNPMAALALGTKEGYGIGFGGGVNGGYILNPNISIIASVAYITFSSSQSGGAMGMTVTSSSSMASLEFLAGAKYRIGDSQTKPYVIGGAGVADLMSSSSGSSGAGGITMSMDTSASEIDPLLTIGGGVEFPMGNDMNLFAQARYAIAIIPEKTVTQEIMGYTFTFKVPGSTFSYIPVEVGLNFKF